MDKKANNHSTDVGKRINDTKREIAQLNEELEKLINSNVNKKNPLVEVHEKKESIDTSVNRFDNSKQSPKIGSGLIMKYSTQSKTSPIIFSRNMDTLESLCKKTKSYNKEAAKEYIRQQRERREEERKKLNSKNRIEQEIKKQKLFELQQKSLALVQRNVQLKRERSKSRDNKLQIRIDKSICSNKATKMLDKETAFYEPYNTRKVNNSSNFRVQNNDNLKNVQIKIDKGKYNMLNVPVKCKEQLNGNVVSVNSPMGSSSKYLEDRPLKYVPSSKITLRSDSMDCLSYADQDLAATKIQAYYRGYRLRKKVKNIQCKSDHCMRMGTYPKKSKETQTNVQEQQIVTPVWLQPPPIDPYPCNFINTVKRKLQFAMNSGNLRDMGTQSSIISSCSNGLVKCDNKNEDKIQLGAKSCIDDRLISFNSHKCSNLDADALQHLVLIHNEKKTEHNINGTTESESDTSKNIPEICSEGALIPNPNDKTVSILLENSNNLIINTDRIKDLHLTDPINKYKANSQISNKVSRDSTNIDRSMSKKSYTFNFYDEHNTEDEDDSVKQAKSEEQKYLKSPRDSLLSFNRSEYGNTSQEKITDNSLTSLGSNQSVHSENQQSRASLKKSMSNSNICSDIHQHNSKNVMTSNIFEKYDESSSKIIENIENSINTSLVSHISDNRSDSSYISTGQSKKSSTPSKSKSSVTKKHTPKELFERTISPINLMKHMHSNDSNEHANSIENSSKLLIPIHSSTILKVKRPPNSNCEEKNQKISKCPNVNNNLKTCNIEQLSSSLAATNLKHNKELEQSSISTKYSNLTIKDKKFGHQENSQSQSEVKSPYSSNFSTEKTDSFNKTEDISEQNKCTKVEKTKLKNETHPQVENVNPESDIINNLNNEIGNDAHLVKNINSNIFRSKGDMNEIHLKFEAEVHLLNDFNESLKQFMAVEKAFETIKSKNEGCCMKFHSRNSSISNGQPFSEHSNISVNLSRSKLSSVNLCRGSEFDDSHFSSESFMKTPWKSLDNSMDLEVSTVEENVEKSTITVREKLPNNLAGLSIKMFEQLIKDEDVRIENLKTIIKIREQALLDRTKGELAWLEIQRKHLRETGRTHEASLVKKKQRGILLKHQQERREMQRLKQLQKMQSNERKTILKEQRNLIKAKLTSAKDMSELKIHTPRKRQSNGPMKVLKTSGSVHSEDSMSKKASDWEEILSITSKSQSIRLSEVESSRELIVNTDETNIRMIGDQNNLSNMKKALLIRQTALMERRKAVEDLLYRHQKLLEEEKKIEELEMAANAIIMQMPTINHPKSVDGSKLHLKGKHLSELCQKKGLLSEKKINDNKSYCISQSTYNRLRDETTNYGMKRDNDSKLRESLNKKSPVENSTDTVSEMDDSVCKVTENKKSVQDDDSVSLKKSSEYSENFELDPEDIIINLNIVPDSNENNLSSITELIQDFSDIEHGISMLSKQFNPASSHIASHNSHNGSQPMNEYRLSCIETNIPNLKSITYNPAILNEILQSVDNCSEIETSTNNDTLLESSKNEELSETENMASSIVTVADHLDSIEMDRQNSSKIMSNTFIEDVVPLAKTQFQHSQSENTPKHSNEKSREVNATNQKNTISGIHKTELCKESSHDKSTISDDSVTTEVEDGNLSNNSSDLTTLVSLQKSQTIRESSIIQTVSEDSSKPNSEAATTDIEDRVLSNNSSNLTMNVSLRKDETIHESSIVQTVTEDLSKLKTESVTTEVEDRASSNNSSRLTTNVSLQKDETIHESSIIQTVTEDSSKLKTESVTTEVEDRASSNNSSRLTTNVSLQKDETIHESSIIHTATKDVSDLESDSVETEVEDRILSNNSSNLGTNVSLQKDKTIQESSIIQTVTKDLSNVKSDSVAIEVEDRILSNNSSNLTTNVNLYKDQTHNERLNIQRVTEESDTIIQSKNNSSIEEVHDSMIINENSSLSEKSNLIETEPKSKENISEKVNTNTDNMKDFQENSLSLEQSNSDLMKEEKITKKISSVSEDISSESYLEQQNVEGLFDLNDSDLAFAMCKNISSEQTAHEDNLDFNNSKLHQIDNQISVALPTTNNSLSLKNQSTSKKTVEEYSDESYSGIAKLFEKKLSKSDNTTGLNSTDISEKLSTDSEHLDISELSPDDSSDNYTDDFDDENEGDSITQKDLKNYSNVELLADTNSTSHFDSSEMQKKKLLRHKEDEVFMMKIDLTPKELINEASIIVMLENKPNSQEKSYINDKSETKKHICVPSEEFPSLPDDKKKIEVDDIAVIEQKLALRDTDSEVENLEIVKPEVLLMNVREKNSEMLLNTVESPKITNDKDVHYQDYHVTTYEDVTPVNSPESVSPVKSSALPTLNIFGSEAEELLKKQIAIEQEIKHLEQQQKEQLPFVYMREIPNKPPPPYTPPSTLSSHTATLLPSKVEDVDEICSYSAKVLYNAYLSNKLNDVTFSEADFKSINQTKSTEECCLFVFDLCREVAKNHYKRFEKDNDPYWLKVSSDSRLILGKPFDYCQLEKHINTKVKILLGFEKENIKENSVVRWIKKKKDHVDEILALESQFEEKEWLDYEKDELMVKNEVTNEILNILLNETIDIYKRIFS